jgi:phosphoribosylaminoimidazole-succinocarboxamide synthase
VINTMNIQPLRSGKVRDVYQAGDHLILVASDRISAFDCILPTPIPDKGKILTQLSSFWFEKTHSIIPNHVLSSRVEDFPAPFNDIEEWKGRAILAKRAEILPVECVARGYLAGGGWKEYRETGSVSGVLLPAGLRESEKLPEPIFTPSTKAESGHDEPISFEQVVEIIGEQRAAQLRDLTLEIYAFAAAFALEKGVIIADTKFEFGRYNDELILCDEILTPDSSRFWDVKKYSVGKSQDSFDKQYVRDYLETLDWDKTPPAPELPPEVARNTSQKYSEAFERLTGKKWHT